MYTLNIEIIQPSLLFELPYIALSTGLCHFLFLIHKQFTGFSFVCCSISGLLCKNFSHTFVAIPITIGLRQRLYYVDEDSGPVVVCYDVLSGRTASRSISMQLVTVQGDAISEYREEKTLLVF